VVAVHRNFDTYHGSTIRGFTREKPFLHVIGLRRCSRSGLATACDRSGSSPRSAAGRPLTTVRPGGRIAHREAQAGALTSMTQRVIMRQEIKED
jgi:hypothetical protein